MNMQNQIERQLTASFNPSVLEVINESHMHHGPPGRESHFKVTVVSEQFEGKRLIERHRIVNQALSTELPNIHALALHTLTPDEYKARAGKVPDSPACKGGSKA